MPEQVYRRLAQRLDSIPYRFPATETGAELRLLAKLFAPAEAALAGAMHLTPEPAGDVAARAGVDVESAQRILEGMAKRGLIRAREVEGILRVALRPFFPGFYESQLPRMDEELARLFEEYYQETRAGLVRDIPPLQRVIPVGEAIPVEMEVFPYERAAELLEGSRSWGVRQCVCRVQRRLVGQGCDRPLENCLLFSPVEGSFDQSEVDRAISKEEALQILREAEVAGLVHSAGNFRSGISYICNCCTCCCAVMRGLSEFGIPTAVARSGFRAASAAERCSGCGECIGRCPFGALALSRDVVAIDHARCLGCGLCAAACPVEALHLERRPAGDTALPPADLEAWREESVRARGVSPSDT